VANSLLSPTIITREALRILHAKLNFIGTAKQYDDSVRKLRRFAFGQDRSLAHHPHAEPVHRPHRIGASGAGHRGKQPGPHCLDPEGR
jgi:hypothetical protein